MEDMISATSLCPIFNLLLGHFPENVLGIYSDECFEFLLLCLTLDSNKRADIKRLKETQYYQRYAKDVYENQEVIAQFFHEHQIFNQVYREQFKQYQNGIYYLTKKDIRFNMTALEGKLIFPQDNKIYDFSMKDMEEINELAVTRNVVHKFKHKKSGSFLAIKKIKLPEVKTQLFSSQDKIKQEEKTQRKLDRFRSEVKALFILSFSPYIVYYYGITTLDGYLLIGMELMDTNLMEFYCFVHKRDGRFPETLLGTVVVSIINALTYCSDKNILHRDIKPLNILLNKEGCIKLADFGESLFLDPMSLPKTGCGTIIYWPPERLTMESVEKGYDECSDVWSLGITVAEVEKGEFRTKIEMGSHHQI
uniref:mitogen-activated protein kinase kinase n=1 Tax=Acrobeloides nanus TaxID=290746 RepID=A0A914DA43_9BILA